jgi:sugar phosphate isomerase/epimerase
MELSLYTDSTSSLSLDDTLDFAAAIGATAVEIAAGGQSAAPHMRVFDLLADPAALRAYGESITSRGLRLGAVNCSAWPLHPRYGDRHEEIIKAAIRLAHELEVDKIVTMSGCPGDTRNALVLNWITFPWPADTMEVLDKQWEQAISFWHQLADYAISLGITRIALELHPLHLVYSVPTLTKLRGEIGPVIGANVDPSHMFWQQVDPITVVRALGPAVQHVHLKDLQFNIANLAVAGVLDLTPFDEPDKRAWNFRTIGQGHGAEFWKSFIQALADVGYHDVLSIENEDPYQPQQEGVRQAAEFIMQILPNVAAPQRS